MSPQQKAYDLVKWYSRNLPVIYDNLCFATAKRCATMTVLEIMKSERLNGLNNNKYWWQTIREIYNIDIEVIYL